MAALVVWGGLPCLAAERLSVCALQSEARRWEGKSVEVEGFVSRGFEDSGLFDPGCEGGEPVWVEYGGTAGTGVIRCCGVEPQRQRKQPVSVEGVRVTLVEDSAFRRFDRLLQIGPDRVVRARLLGRFFAAQMKGGTRSGYGHMGCCSLFVIERVLAVGEQRGKEIDYRAAVDQPEGATSYGDLMTRGKRWDWLRWQREAEAAGNEWRVSDARRVAMEVLAERLGLEREEVSGLRKLEKRGEQIWFAWSDEARGKRYFVVVSKPYFVAYYASHPRKAAWVVRAVWATDAR